MNIVVDPDDPTPPYEQLRRQIGDLIGSGSLAAGDRLPPLRQLANDLGLAVGTVARAYRALEGEGLLLSRRGGGTRVAPAAAPFPTQERQKRLADLTASYIARARALGASDDDIRDSLATLGARPEASPAQP